MLDQHCIGETLSNSAAIAPLEVLRAQAGHVSQTAFARQVCRAFDFVDSRGEPQLANCHKVLRELHRQGRIALPPPPLGPAAARAARRAGQRGAVAGLRLSLVSSPQQRQTWNELVAAEHPHGAVLHVGAQLRYLIESEHGVLGALGFAASALALAARDE